MASAEIRFPRMMDVDVSAQSGDIPSSDTTPRTNSKKSDAKTKRRTWPVEDTGNRDHVFIGYENKRTKGCS